MEHLRPPVGGRSVIPPTSPARTHTGEALSVLQHRLASVEDDAKDLVNQLAKMGFHASTAEGSTNNNNNDTSKDPALLTVPPYKAPMADTKVLQQNYEVLVSRVCKMESAVQTMKLNLLRAQAERDLSKEEKASANEKLTSTAEAYEKELTKLSRELVQARKDVKEGQEDRRRAQEDVRRLQEALEVATTGKSEAAGMIEDLRATKAKCTRRVGELREELGREASLRASLEESHNTLLSRVQDMEDIVTREQEEVTKLNTTCSHLKRDCLRAREEAELERALRLQAEDTIKKLTSKSEGRQSELETLQEDKAYLMTEMNKLRQRYQDLIAQLDQTHQLATDKQTTHDQLEKENKRLYEAMKSAAAQNAKLIAKYEQELEELRAEAVAKAQGEQHIKELSEQLRSESRQKGHVLATSSQQEARIQELEEKVQRQEADLTERTEKHRKEVTELRESLRDKEAEKDHALRDKDSLLDEVNQAVDEMVEERGRLQAQLAQKDVDLQSAEQTCKQLEQENGRLLERLAALEDQAAASGQVEKALSDMMEQKNKLSYDKGRLSNRVEDLQREVESLANSQSELTQLRKTAAAMEANYKKMQTELNNGRITIQRLESQVKQSQNSGNRKEEDFRLAIKARDEALQEAQRLMDHIETLEDRERQRVSGLERSLGDTRQDNKKVAATLDSVMQSHSQLQMTVEGLQLELGRRDARITQLSADKSDLTHRTRQLQKELDNLQSKLVSMDTLEANEIDPLRSALQQCKSDNAKMASSLETVVRSNGQLQASVQALQDEAEKKTFLLEQTNNAREKEREQHALEVRSCEDRLVQVKEQLAREKEKAIKRNNKEVLEVRRQLEDLLGKNGDLSRANADLRHRVTDLDYECREQKEKVSAQRAQNEHLTRVRQKQDESVRSLQTVSEQLTTLEKSNREYVKKNDNQAKLIQKFMSQMASIQEELHGVAQTQSDMAGMLQQQEEQLRAERSKYDDLKRKYKATRRREVELEDLRRQTEEKLLEANSESLEISANLTDAHSWFKSKFDSLQTELTKSRQDRDAEYTSCLMENLQDELREARKNQAGLVHENYEAKMLLEGEKKKAQETAEKARQMIKASRETISRLADYAEVAQKETRNQMLGMRHRLESEKDHARSAEARYKGLQESSLRHTEQLARELDMMRSGYNRHYDSLDSSG